MALRFETIGDAKVGIVLGSSSTRDLARELAVGKKDLGDDDPFAVFNLGTLVDRFIEWRTKMPRVEPFYAVKCNNDPVLLKVLADLGAGFDCASRAELDMILDTNLTEPLRIIYANPCKTKGFIKYACKRGVRTMTFDNEEELLKIKELHESPQLVLRIAASDPTAQCPLSAKYGCDPEAVGPQLLKKALEVGVPIIGISFHVGSGCRSPIAFRSAIAHARRLFDLGTEMGHSMRLLDIGGGFPGFDSEEVSFDQIVEVISPCLEEFFPPAEGLSIIAEPGRFFASAPMSIVGNITSAVQVPASRITGNEENAEQNGYFYYLNDGVYGSFNCILFDHYQPKGEPLFNDENGELFESRVWGPTCDSLDLIEESTRLPHLEVGDWLYYANMGAYTQVAATTFNGFPKPKCFHFMDSTVWSSMYENNNESG